MHVKADDLCVWVLTKLKASGSAFPAIPVLAAVWLRLGPGMLLQESMIDAMSILVGSPAAKSTPK